MKNKLSKTLAIAKFRVHWQTLGTPGNEQISKKQALDIIGETSHIDNDCYLCEYDNRNNRKHCGRNCLIDWDITNGCMIENSIFWKWCNEKDQRIKRQLAIQISNLKKK